MLLTLGDVFALIGRQWKVIVVTFVVVMAAIVVVYKTSQREYRADVVLVPIQDVTSDLAPTAGAGVSQVAALLGASTGSNWRQESLAFLRSRQLARTAIGSLGLLDELAPLGAAEDPESMQHALRMSRAVMRFQKRVVRISEDRPTGIVTVSAFASDPVKAANIVNGYVAEANRLARESALSQLKADRTHLTREVAGTTAVEVRAVLLTLLERNMQALSLANARQDYAYRIIDPAVAGGRETAVSPKLTSFAVFGSVLAGLLALTIAMVIDHRRRLQRPH